MKYILFFVACLATGLGYAQSGAAPQVKSAKTGGASAATSRAKTIVFVPDRFCNFFSSKTPPVLHISPGDIVRTESVDAEGIDKHGVKRATGSNPLTGPFYIEGAKPGDVIAVHLRKLKINRSWASGAKFFVPRSLPDSVLKKLPRAGAMNWDLTAKWNIDPVLMLARPDSPSENLRKFAVPVKPMLGCVGLAPEGNEISTDDAGPFGGNMDFSLITKGATVYLPVFHPGGLLFVGDAHAMQGDGELNMAALEISMDIEFTVSVIPHQQMQLSYPRIEDSMYVMTVGLAEHLDDAFKIANAGMLHFLQNEYELTDVESAQVMGTSIEYQIPEITDPQVEVVAKIKKSRLSLLRKHDKK